jgi:hypothetical protein
MDRKIGILGRDPALILAFIAATLGALTTQNIDGLSDLQAAGILVLCNALFGVWTAVHVRPIAPAAFTYAFGAAAALAGLYGLNLSPELVAGINGVIVAGFALLARGQIAPQPGALVSEPKV